MKIGLYGGVANNMYVCAKAFAKQKLEVCFVRDRGDRFPFSQPVWEDVPCTIDYRQLSQVTDWTWPKWKEFETKLGWKPPGWLVDPFDRSNSWETDRGRGMNPGNRLVVHFLFKKRPYWREVLHQMRRCDVLLVSGVDGALFALMSNRPFVILPHGADIRMAAELNLPHFPNLRTRWKYRMFLHFLKKAYRRALWIGSHDPTFSGGDTNQGFPRLRNLRFKPLHLPMSIRERVPRDKRMGALTKLMEPLGLPVPRADYIGFIPSRVDFFWKGHDRFIRAFSRVPEGGKIHLIVSGWGDDYLNAKRMTQDMELGHEITFLPCSLSKPLLFDMFKTVDFVVDQFSLGIYGTSALEAMSCGTPVMIWIDEEAFRRKGWEAPPVLNAKDEDDIARTLSDILKGDVQLEEQGHAAQDWVRRTHNEETVPLAFMDSVRRELSASPRLVREKG